MARRRRDVEVEPRPGPVEAAVWEINHLHRFMLASSGAFAERLRAELSEAASAQRSDVFARLDSMRAVIDRNGVRDWAENHLAHMREVEARRYDGRSTSE